MALLRATAERMLLRDNEHVLLLLGRATAPAGGTNPEVGDAIAKALLQLGYEVADLDAGPTDADLEAVRTPRLAHLLALADVLFKEGLLGNLVAWANTQYGVNREEFASMARALEAAIGRRWADIGKLYGSGRDEFVTGELSPKPQPPDAIDAYWLGDA
jgi:hypothetical protein